MCGNCNESDDSKNFLTSLKVIFKFLFGWIKK